MTKRIINNLALRVLALTTVIASFVWFPLLSYHVGLVLNAAGTLSETMSGETPPPIAEKASQAAVIHSGGQGKCLIPPPRSSKSKKPLISVCIPVYKSAETIQETLESVLNQTHDNLQILLSLDLSLDSDQSAQIIQQIQSQKKEARISVFRQKEHLGWVHNTNFLTRMATGDYVSVMPSDDTIPAHYYEALLKCLEENPQAVNCYPIIAGVSHKGYRLSSAELLSRQESIRGKLTTERVLQAIGSRNHVSFRGLVRRNEYDLFLLKPLHNGLFFSDITQAVQHALAGELIEINVTYWKKYHNDATHLAHKRNKKLMKGKDWRALLCHHSYHVYMMAHSYMPSSYEFFTIMKTQQVERFRETFADMVSSSNSKRVAVLGGGIQGTLMALLFRKHGYDVTIFDNSTDVLNRASAHHEGKVHLGLVYSKDATMKTGKHMLESALHFASAMEYLLDKKIDWNDWKGSKFHYMVPHDSLLTPDELESFFAKLQVLYHEIIDSDPSLSYLGERPAALYRRTTMPKNVNSTFFAAAFDTAEFAVRHSRVKSAIKNALRDKEVRVILNTYISGVTRNEEPRRSATGKFRVTHSLGESDFGVVVNCLWEGRAAIDRQMGLPMWSGDNVRLKFGVFSQYIDELASLPSMTIVNGRYGDFVSNAKDQLMYFSWYPISMHGMAQVSQGINAEWNDIANGVIPSEVESYQLESHQDNFQRLFPGLPLRMKCPKLIAGFILGNGDKDVHHVDSQLHERADDPIMHQDGYFSVSTQKFTSAPYNAFRFEQRYLL